MTDKELYLLTHPEEWTYEGVLTVTRRGGDPICNKRDCGVVFASKITIVFASPVPYEKHRQAASCRGLLTSRVSSNNLRIVSNARRKAPLVSSLSGTRLNS